jgi:hypothetical protein
MTIVFSYQWLFGYLYNKLRMVSSPEAGFGRNPEPAAYSSVPCTYRSGPGS